MRWVVYVDMDAFFVACEQLDRPELVGAPVIVGPSPRLGATRGVVLSASYEARRFGVHSAQPVAEAARRAPDAIWVAPDHAKYARRSKEVRRLLEERYPAVRPHSIDEFEIGIDASPGLAEQSARRIQAAIRERIGLPCSIGVASHRPIAKIASDRAKPGGVVVVRPESARRFLAPLAVGAIPGVGPKTAEALAARGVATIGELAERTPSELRAAVGGWAGTLLALARGAPRPDPVDEAGPRSRSADRTFSEDVKDPREVEAALGALAAELARTLREERLRFGRAGIAVRWADFDRVSRTRKLPGLLEGAPPLEAMARRLFREVWAAEQLGGRRAVRAVSVRVERLEAVRQRQASLDGAPSP